MSSRYTDVETITPEQRMQIIGLLTVARDLLHRMDDVERAACAITGEEPGGHTGDAMWGERTDVDDLLGRLSIKCAPEPRTEGDGER